jgi:hypothetical protein
MDTALDNLGEIVCLQRDYASAHPMHAESPATWRELGDKSGITGSHANMEIMAYGQGDYVTAALYMSKALLSGGSWETNPASLQRSPGS